jgi:signal transduction histidine kinase
LKAINASCYDEKMNKKFVLEQGILRTFKLFSGVRIALALFGLLVFLVTNGWKQSTDFTLLVFAILDASLLFLFLSIPRFEFWLKQYFFPVAIFWATLGPIIQLQLTFSYYSTHTPDRSAVLYLLLPVLVMFIPLVLVSWQYSMHAVTVYSLVSFVADNFLVFVTYKFFNMPFLHPIIGMSFVRTVMFMLVGYMIVNLMKVQREQHTRLSQANLRLTQYAATMEQLSTSRERNRMARELHDVLAHTMSGVAVELEGVRAMLRTDADQAERLLGQSLQAVREGLTETRRSLQALRASPLEDLGLGLAVSNLVESITNRSGLETEVHITDQIRDCPVEVQQCFYRVAQEALSNIVIHAQAQHITVTLTNENACLWLCIEDDGVGFDPNRVDLSQKYGLLGMQERVEMIQGQLMLDSRPGSGTTINLTYGESL